MIGTAAADAPSAELLLYLAEFADDEGKPEDPIQLERKLPQGKTSDDQRKTAEPTNDRKSDSRTEPDDAPPRPAPAADD